MSGWSGEERAFVTDAWLGGKSAAEISRHLKAAGHQLRSRNAVIGLVHRMGLSGRVRASYPSKTNNVPARLRAPKVKREYNRPPKPGPQKRPALILGTTYIEGPDSDASREACRRDGLSHLERVITGAGVESPNAVPLLDHVGGCKWPLGERHETRLCCNPIARGSYCEGHAAVAYDVVATERARKARRGMVALVNRTERIDLTDQRFTNGMSPARPDREKAEPSPWDDAREAA